MNHKRHLDPRHGYTRISKREFYLSGGFSNPRNIRVTRRGTWAYLTAPRP